MRAELRQHGMAAHERHGTWVLLDDAPADRPSRPTRDADSTAERDSSGEAAEGSEKLVGLPAPHIVHMNGRSFLPPQVKRNVEAEFRRQAAGEYTSWL